jgi:hypothetical protein
MSTSQSDISNSVLADRRVRALIGLSGFLSIAVVAVFFVDGTLFQAVLLGVGVLDLFVTPYILGRLVEGDTAETPEWSG